MCFSMDVYLYVCFGSSPELNYAYHDTLHYIVFDFLMSHYIILCYIVLYISIQVTAAMAADREFVNIVLARRPWNWDPKLPRSTRLNSKPLKSMPWDYPEGSQNQPRKLGVPRSAQGDQKMAKS